MGQSPSAGLVAGIAEAASFGSMKDTTRREAPKDGKSAFKVEHAFFDSATSDKWKGRLSKLDLDAYHCRFAELATPEEIIWLEAGASGV
jgi:aryl sulfotransferase